jgi:alpha-tubulin suppressor-like RCC1 family protein
MGDALPFVDLGTGRSAVTLSLGGSHTCALLDNGSVKCWGDNDSGQLGQGDVSNRGDGPGEMGDALLPVNLEHPAVGIAAGAFHSCVLLDNGSVKCWGYNYYGELGLGDQVNRGNTPGGMGSALPAVSLAAGRTATAIEAGTFHTCALLDDGGLKCWGDNGDGQLGLGDTSYRGDAANEMGEALPGVNLGSRPALSLAVGGYFNCAVLDDMQVKCWGDNGVGQLGLGDLAARGDGPNEMGDALPYVTLWISPRIVRAGARHACALGAYGSMACWGDNADGQLGLGDTADRSGANPVDVGSGRQTVDAALGGRHTCVLLDDASVKCWGGNGNGGQLGLGTTAMTVGANTGEMGDLLPALAL